MLNRVTTALYNLYLVVRNWVFQSYLYVERTEFIFKIVFELVVFTLLLPVLALYFTGVILVTIAAVITHTISWCFNGDIHVLRKSIDLGSDQSISEKLSQLENICIRASKDSSIQAVGIVGSAARGEMTSTSDIDLRIVRKPGVKAAIGACVFLLKERVRAFCLNMSLDCYLYDDLADFKKDAESPLIFDYEYMESDIETEFEKVLRRINKNYGQR